MKRRMQQFFEDHQVGTYVAAALAVATTITVAHKMKGKDIDKVDFWSRDDTSMILVKLKNGENRVFTKTL